MVNISFAPGLVPVLKHQSGKHDQKTHGRRIGGRGSFMSEFRDEAVSVLGLSSDMQIFDTNSDGTMSYHAKNADSSELKKAVAKRLADNMSSSTMDMLPTDADLDPSLDEYARKTAAGALVSNWAATSNDHSDVALAIQMAAREEFNLTAAASWPQSASRGSNGMEIDPSSPQGILNRKVQKRYEQDGAVYRDFVRTQYDLTQEMFNRRGITEVTVYRGFNDKETMESRKLGDPKISSINTRPLSSWSLDPNTAMEFAEEQNGLVVKSVIRTDQILATPVTGVGCWAESEIVTVSTYIDGEVTPQWRATERMAQDWDSDGFSDYETVTLPPLLKAAMSSIIEIDNNDSNADWIKSLRWDLPTDPDELERLFGYGWRERMESLPVWLAAPDSVKNGLSKHLGSEHDQKTHGSWSASGSPKLEIMGQNDGVNKYFNENTRVVRYQPEGKKPKDYVLYAQKDFVVSIVKPTDGTTIDGYSEGGTNKGEIGHLDITGAGENAWRRSAKDDNKATIIEVAVREAHQRQGLASAMLRFHRDMYPELDVQHSDALLPEGKAWAEVAKHQSGKHDQKTHGVWASGSNEINAGLSKMASRYKDFESFSIDYSLNGIRPRVWHTTENPDFAVEELFRPTSRTGAQALDPVLFTTTDPEYWEDYTSGRDYVVEYDISDLVYGFDKDYYSDQSGNDGLVILPSGYSKLEKIGMFSRQEAQERSEKQRQNIPKSKDELFEIWDVSPSVEKHQSGKHDQKTHGTWATGSSDLPDGWTQQSEESRIQEFIARQRAEGSTDTDERLTKVYGKAFADTDEYAGLNSTRVIVSRDAKVSGDDLSTQLKTVADLQRIAPVQDLRVEIDDRAFRFAQLDDGVGGFVVQGGQTIYLRPSSVTDGLDLSKGNLMPVLNKKTYALVHEYGHVLDQRSAETSSSDKGNVLTQAQTGMSRYASGEEPLGASGREAFAEAWTGWVGSQGRLANPVGSQQSFVGYYADKYGWDSGGEGVVPSAGFAKAQGRMILADTFTDEGSVVQFLPEDVMIKFAPGLIPVLKHQSGKHDQKLHGRWSGSSSNLPEGWVSKSREDVKARLVDKWSVGYPYDIEYANELAEDFLDNTWDYSGPNNTTVISQTKFQGSESEPPNPESLNTVLDALSKCQKQTPVDGLVVEFSDRPFREENVQKEAKGFVVRGTKKINMRPGFLDGPPSSFRSADGHFMPEYKNTKNNLEYYITHEYGHVVDNRSQGFRGEVVEDRSVLDSSGSFNSLSKYGQASDVEAYAESYAEWSLSDGESSNEAATYFADKYGWGDGVSKSAGSFVEETLIVDTFELDVLPSVVRFSPGLVPTLKHLGSKHDQKTHGRWSASGEVSLGQNITVKQTGENTYDYSYFGNEFTVDLDYFKIRLRPDEGLETVLTVFTGDELDQLGEVAQMEQWNQWEGNYNMRTISGEMMGLNRPAGGSDYFTDSELTQIANRTGGWDEVYVPTTHAMMSNAANSVPTDFSMERAMVVRDNSRVLETQTGDSIAMPLSGFSPQAEIVDRFKMGGALQADYSEDVYTPNLKEVVFNVEPGAKGVRMSPDYDLSYDPQMPQELPLEVTVQGRFEVTGRNSTFKTNPFTGEDYESVEFKIKQTQVFNPATGEYDDV